MYLPLMKTYPLKKPVVTTNEYNESVISYIFDRNIEMAITPEVKNDYNGNDQVIFNVIYAGITRDRAIEKGDLIDDTYYVQYVEINRLYVIVHMKQIDNIGEIDD